MLPHTGDDVSYFPLANKFSLCSLNRGVSQTQNPILSMYFLGQRVITIFMSVKILERNRWHTKIGLFTESFKMGLFARMWVGFRESTQPDIVPSSWEQRGTITTPRPPTAMRISFQNVNQTASLLSSSLLMAIPQAGSQENNLDSTLRNSHWMNPMRSQGQGHPRM